MSFIYLLYMIELHLIQEHGKIFERKGDKLMNEAKEICENLSAEDQEFVKGLKDVDVTESDLLKQEQDIFSELKASFETLKV